MSRNNATTSKPTLAPPAAKTPARKAETPDERDHGAHLAAEAAGGHSVELALSGSARSTGYLFGPGVSAVVDWDLGGWLLGGLAHAEEASGPTGAAGRFYSERNASIGALFGRRLVRRPFLVDVALEAPVFALHTSRWTSHVVATSPAESESDDLPSQSDDDAVLQTRTQATPTTFDLRAGGFVRAVVPFAGHFGATLAADGERSLNLLRTAASSGQPASLAWNFGLSLGLFWSGG